MQGLSDSSVAQARRDESLERKMCDAREFRAPSRGKFVHYPCIMCDREPLLSSVYESVASKHVKGASKQSDTVWFYTANIMFFSF